MNEVLIIGGGPAGSTVGCYLSRAGIQNVILESHMHSRPHVGESLVMDGYWSATLLDLWIQFSLPV